MYDKPAGPNRRYHRYPIVPFNINLLIGYVIYSSFIDGLQAKVRLHSTISQDIDWLVVDFKY